MAEIIDVVMRLTDNVTSGLKRMRSEMEQTARANQRMGRNIQNAGRHITAMGQAMVPLAAGIAGVGAIGVKTFMDFEQTITGAAVKAGATTEEMKQMRDAAAQMGAKFPTNARDVAAGMDRLAAGGFNAAQTIGAMPGIIEASIASGEDLASTSDVITSALSIWNLTQGDVAANTTRVADVVQAAANASKLGMADFGTAMQYAGAPAAALGISIEQLGTAMGIMANNGLEASTIGTSLRSTLSRLASPPKAAAAALDQLRISTADLKKGDGSFIGLASAVDILRSRMTGLSDVEQVAAAKAIAGEEAYSGLLALIKTSPADYQKMSDTIANSSGSSHASYMQMQNTLKGSVDALMSSVEALGISFGSALAPTIRSVAGGLKSIADALTTMSPEMRNMLIHVGEGIIAFTGFTLAAGKLIQVGGGAIKLYGDIGRVMHGTAIGNKALQFGVQGAMRAFSMLRIAGAALMGPMGIAVAAIAGAAYLIYRNWDTIGPMIQESWTMIREAFSSVYDAIAPAIDALRESWNTLVNAFSGGSGSFGMLQSLAGGLGGVLGNIVVGAVRILSAAFTNVLVPSIRIVGTIVTGAIGAFSGLIEFITGVFTGDWSLAWKGIVDIFSNVFGSIKGVAEVILGGVSGAINNVIDGINSISVTIPDWVPGYGGKTFSPNIPRLARGTDNWIGGPVVINEKGGELVDLPNGSRVIPHDQSMRTAYNMGASSHGFGDIHININGVTVTNGQDVKELARQVAMEIENELEKVAINSTMGAI